MVSKKKQQKAVALRYRPEKEGAPAVTAKGSGVTAEKIIEIARKHGIHIQNDPDLVEILSQLDLEQTIPPEIYIVVAELLAFVYAANSRGSVL